MFGRGPWENYSDRKASAIVGRYRSTVSEQYVPYIMPQEHGHKTDVRWMSLRNGGDKGREFRIAGAPTFEFNATHFSAEDLYAAKHTTDLVPRAETILYLDCAHRGLGTGSCGPDTLERYRLLQKRYRWRYRNLGLRPNFFEISNVPPSGAAGSSAKPPGTRRRSHPGTFNFTSLPAPVGPPSVFRRGR